MTKPVTPQDMFDMWQKMVNPGAYPLQSLMFPVLDPDEIQKKISELGAVEHWLKANVTMIQLTVRSLQYQLALLKGGEKAQEVMAEASRGATSGAGNAQGEEEAPNPAMWAWNMMANAGKSGSDAVKAATPAAPKRRPKAKPTSRKA
jgi:hypothetical protein